jgi:hypothetical protein
MSTQSGWSASSPASRLLDDPGPWWRTPNVVTVIGRFDSACSVGSFATRLVQVAPAVAFLHDRLEVFAPDDRVLHRVADDGARETGGDVPG